MGRYSIEIALKSDELLSMFDELEAQINRNNEEVENGMVEEYTDPFIPDDAYSESQEEIEKVFEDNNVYDDELQIELENFYASAGSINTITKAVERNFRERVGHDPHKNRKYTISEKEANKLGYYPDPNNRNHRDDRVKLEDHPTHPSRGLFVTLPNGKKVYKLSSRGMRHPNYSMWGARDNGDGDAILMYGNTFVLPEITVTPNKNYIKNTYDNIKYYNKSRKKANGGPLNLFVPGGYVEKLETWKTPQEKQTEYYLNQQALNQENFTQSLNNMVQQGKSWREDYNNWDYRDIEGDHPIATNVWTNNGRIPIYKISGSDMLKAFPDYTWNNGLTFDPNVNYYTIKNAKGLYALVPQGSYISGLMDLSFERDKTLHPTNIAVSDMTWRPFKPNVNYDEVRNEKGLRILRENYISRLMKHKPKDGKELYPTNIAASDMTTLVANVSTLYGIKQMPPKQPEEYEPAQQALLWLNNRSEWERKQAQYMYDLNAWIQRYNYWLNIKNTAMDMMLRPIMPTNYIRGGLDAINGYDSFLGSFFDPNKHGMWVGPEGLAFLLNHPFVAGLLDFGVDILGAKSIPKVSGVLKAAYNYSKPYVLHPTWKTYYHGRLEPIDFNNINLGTSRNLGLHVGDKRIAQLFAGDNGVVYKIRAPRASAETIDIRGNNYNLLSTKYPFKKIDGFRDGYKGDLKYNMLEEAGAKPTVIETPEGNLLYIENSVSLNLRERFPNVIKNQKLNAKANKLIERAEQAEKNGTMTRDLAKQLNLEATEILSDAGYDVVKYANPEPGEMPVGQTKPYYSYFINNGDKMEIMPTWKLALEMSLGKSLKNTELVFNQTINTDTLLQPVFTYDPITGYRYTGYKRPFMFEDSEIGKTSIPPGMEIDTTSPIALGPGSYDPNSITPTFKLKLKSVNSGTQMTSFPIDNKYKGMLNKAFSTVDKNIQVEGIIKEGNLLIPYRTVELPDGRKLPSYMRKHAISETEWNNAVKKMDNYIAKERNKILDPPNHVTALRDKYGLDFSAEEWFRNRLGWHNEKNPLGYTELDITDWYNHTTEYKLIAEDLIESGQMYKENNNWYGIINGKPEKLVDPEAYIVSKSKAFVDNGYVYHNTNLKSAVKPEHVEDFIKNAGSADKKYLTWTTNGLQQISEYLRERNGIIFSSLVGSENNAMEQIIPANMAHDLYVLGNSYGTYPRLIESKHTNPLTGEKMKGIWRLFGPKVRIKSIRGNNGNFRNEAGLFSYLENLTNEQST